MIDRAAVLAALREVNDPELDRSLVELNMIRDIQVEGETVKVTVALTVPGCPMQSTIRQAVSERLQQLPGVKAVEVELTAMSEEERRALFGEDLKQAPLLATGVKVVAVASGKGGVGKSTVAVNLAVALAEQGLEVGILDADIYGFSVARLLGISGQPQSDGHGGMLPFHVRGVKAMSMGAFVPEGVPIIWRGPLLGRAVRQFLNEVVWGRLDYLVIDMPPGTGDVALDVAQLMPQSSIVLVTTPERLASDVASRVAHLAAQTGQRLLGVVENMSYFACPKCGERYAVFGQGGGEKLARELGVPLLGQLPLSPELGAEAEPGERLAGATQSEAGEIIRKIAREVRRLTEQESAVPAAKK